MTSVGEEQKIRQANNPLSAGIVLTGRQEPVTGVTRSARQSVIFSFEARNTTNRRIFGIEIIESYESDTLRPPFSSKGKKVRTLFSQGGTQETKI